MMGQDLPSVAAFVVASKTLEAFPFVASFVSASWIVEGVQDIFFFLFHPIQ
jgi:hypothetical protein